MTPSKTTTSKEKDMATKEVSTRKKISQFFWRSWAIQDSWNYERQMNMGFMYGIAPTLDRCYPNADTDPKQLERKKEAYRRHMAFYNCTPQTSAFVLGLSASMEEELAEDPNAFDPDTVNAVKTSLMGPLSGIGDSFFQGTIRVIAFGLGVSLAKQGSFLGPILAMVISIIPSVLVTWFAAKLGYEGGRGFLQKMQSGDLMDRVMYVCGIVGLMAIGGMVATLIGATAPATFAGGAVKIQKLLDSIMPQMIPLALTGAMYWLIKKNVKSGWILAICIFGGILLSVLGILA
jgi:PTS system mannose-specific IID component/fructoselysine and glucoselysine-specific PTS system IID component